MIIKNEINTLRSTIESVKEYVDEIVIGIDEASNDGSRELAHELADKVIVTYLSEELDKQAPHSGEGDYGFSAARNLVLNECNSNNWRLTLDGHEIVHKPHNIINLIKKVKDAGGDGIKVPLFYEKNEWGHPSLMFYQGRLLGPKVRYNNPEHNIPVILRTHRSDDITIEHCRDDQRVEDRAARNEQRNKVNVEGFKIKVEKNPKDSRSWFYLGVAYQENLKWELAIDAFNKYLGVSTWKEERWHARYKMAACYRAIKNLEEAKIQYCMSLDEFPEMVESYYCLGDIAYKQQRFKEAQVWLERCIDMPQPDCDMFLTPSVYWFHRYDRLSMIYSHLFMYHKAIEQAKKALEMTDAEHVKKNLVYWEKHIKRVK